MPIYISDFRYMYSQVSLPGEVNFLGGVEKFSQAGRGIFAGKKAFGL